MFKVFLRTALCAVLVGAFAAPVHAADASAADSSAASNPVVAKVNGKPITRSDVLAEMDSLPAQARQAPVEKLFPYLVDQAIAERVVGAAAYAAHTENSEEVKKELKEAERKIVIDTYLRQQVEAKLTDAKLKSIYDQLKANTKPQDEVKASHILVKTEDEAKDIIKQLKDGADFATLAKKDSIDKASADHGGDVGYFTVNEMVKPFSDAAFAMKVGDVSDTPVKSDYGWHVIKVVDRRPATPPSFDQVKDQLKAHEAQTMANDIVKQLVAEAKVERFEPDGSPMPKDAAAKPATPAAASTAAPDADIKGTP